MENSLFIPILQYGCPELVLDASGVWLRACTMLSGLSTRSSGAPILMTNTLLLNNFHYCILFNIIMIIFILVRIYYYYVVYIYYYVKVVITTTTTWGYGFFLIFFNC
jgi:hypothetical protein